MVAFYLQFVSGFLTTLPHGLRGMFGFVKMHIVLYCKFNPSTSVILDINLTVGYLKYYLSSVLVPSINSKV